MKMRLNWLLKLTLLLLLVSVFPLKTFSEETPGYLEGTDKTTVSEITLFSEALGKDTKYLALLPKSLTPEFEYPVLFLLHGAYGSYVDWAKNTPLAKTHDGRDIIFILPDDTPFGWYVDSKANGNYETFLTTDLIKDVESRFPAAKSREGRGLVGLSMGGHGAISIAAKHPDLYSSSSSLSGI